MILSAYDDYIPINNSMAIQHFLMVITLRMTHGLYRIHTSDWTRKRQNYGVGIYEYMLTCVAFGVNHTVDLHVFFSQCNVLDDVEMTLCDQSEYPFIASLVMIHTTGFKRLSRQNIQNTVV